MGKGESVVPALHMVAVYFAVVMVKEIVYGEV